MHVCFNYSCPTLFTKRFAALDTVQIGPYLVANCKSNNHLIATLLLFLGPMLQPAIEDLGSSSASDAYATFFKDVSYAPYVREIFTNITGGASVVPSSDTPSTVPIFVCIDGRDQVIYSLNNARIDAYDRCQSSGYVTSVALLGTPYILICPKFYNHPSVPVKTPTSCLTVDPSGSRFLQNGLSLIKYKIWHIIHELLHYYVWANKREMLDIYNVNKCVDLPGRRAVLNPSSYEYYATSMCRTQLSLLYFPHFLLFR